MAKTDFDRAWYVFAAPPRTPERSDEPEAPRQREITRRADAPELTAPSAKAEERRRRRESRAALRRAGAAICLVLLLLAASAYVFSDDFGLRLRQRSPAQSRETEAPASPAIPEEYSDDFRQFFEDYMQEAEAESVTGSNLKRTEASPDVALAFAETEGLPEKSLGELYRDTLASIVGIKARTEAEGARGYAWGTGIIFSAEGYIVTNQHIIDGADTASVVLADGAEWEALLVGEDLQTDLAVLRILRSEDAPLVPAAFGDSGALEVGDAVAALGNPLGDELSGTITDGIISAVDRKLDVNGRRMTLLQTNAALNEGNSGGPLLNRYGQVVGITNMKMVNRYSAVSIEGIGFAIPSATVRSVVNQLLRNGKVVGRPGLGITLGPVPEEALEHYALPEGLYVYEVSERGRAAEQGILVGDIVLRVDGQEVRTTDDVLTLRDAHSVGEDMLLTVWRDGKELEIAVTLVDQNLIY